MATPSALSNQKLTDTQPQTEPASAPPSTPRGAFAARKDWLRWRLNRLSCMSAAEIGHRLWRTASMQAERFKLTGNNRVPPADLSALVLPAISVPHGIDPVPYLAAANRLSTGKFDVFSLHNLNLGSPPNWNRDPKTWIEAPLSFGKTLDYRNAEQVGDIKYLWEPNRHMHLVTLAQAYALSGDQRYFEVIRRHLEDWFSACPYGQGVNWSSSLELGIRLINWSLAWQLLGGAQSTVFESEKGIAFRQRWLDSVYQHAEFIRGHFSRYSSANNHLIGEASGLFSAAVTWPHWPQAAIWRDEGQAILEREALLQNTEDGVNREQAISYQQHVIDLLLIPLLTAKANGIDFSDAYQSTIEKMLEFLASIMDAGGNVPMIGDSDDGLAVKLVQGSEDCRYRSVLATGAILFQRSDFWKKAGKLDDKTRWLLGEKAERPIKDATQHRPLPIRQAFHKGGYFILGKDFEGPHEIRLVVDAGPLGYEQIAAHGHADALAFTLAVAGAEFLIDPGTYAYHTQGAWRAYFRGTSAHNTLRVDGQDQSVQGGNFMWLAKAEATCSHWHASAREDVFEGWHDGYRRLSDPVTHQRRIHLDKLAGRIIIEDQLTMDAEHSIELFFHFSERCHIECGTDRYEITQGNNRLLLSLPESVANAQHRLLSGSLDPILGWVSRRFDDKQPSPSIVWSARLRGNTTLRSEILINSPNELLARPRHEYPLKEELPN